MSVRIKLDKVDNILCKVMVSKLGSQGFITNGVLLCSHCSWFLVDSHTKAMPHLAIASKSYLLGGEVFFTVIGKYHG